jgi:hypothetical protein
MPLNTVYDQSILAKAEEYSALFDENSYQFVKDAGRSGAPSERQPVRLPTIEGLALYIHASKTICLTWELQYPEFTQVLAELRMKQAKALIENGLAGLYDPEVTKVLLAKHGYRESIELKD